MPAKKAVKPAPAKENGKPEIAYEAGIAQLEALVERMESGEFSLEETLSAYERGAALHAQLNTILERGERRIQALQIRDGEPDPQAEWVPFEAEE